MIYNFVIDEKKSYLRAALLGESFMSRIVQSACPGCKKRLRIPAEWLQQSIRCKHCGMVLQVKQHTASPKVTSPPPSPHEERSVPAAAIQVAMPVGSAANNDQPFSDFRTNEGEATSRARRQTQEPRLVEGTGPRHRRLRPDPQRVRSVPQPRTNCRPPALR